jgi:hypothetical protein
MKELRIDGSIVFVRPRQLMVAILRGVVRFKVEVIGVGRAKELDSELEE